MSTTKTSEDEFEANIQSKTFNETVKEKTTKKRRIPVDCQVPSKSPKCQIAQSQVQIIEVKPEPTASQRLIALSNKQYNLTPPPPSASIKLVNIAKRCRMDEQIEIETIESIDNSVTIQQTDQVEEVEQIAANLGFAKKLHEVRQGCPPSVYW